MGKVHQDDNTLDPDLIPTIRYGGAGSGTGSSSHDTIVETRRGPARLEPGSGDVLGPWTLGPELGRGALSVVFEATHRRDSGPVALKILTPAGQLSPRAAKRFSVEAWVSRRLRHPGVARVYDDDFESSPPWIAMELLPGGTLADRIRRGPLGIEESVRHMVCVAEAVAEAHAAGIIHRDIKPGNILLTEDGQPVLADFGLAHTRVLSSYLGLSGSGDIIGTPGYMAPEQGEGRPERIDELSDVYALGATLYALLTGRPPFDGASPAERLVQTVTAEVSSARSVRPEVPVAIDRLVRRCLTVDKLDRLESAAEFARIGRVWLGEQAPDGPAPAGRIERVAVSAMIGVTLLAIAAAVLGIDRARTTRSELATVQARVEADLERARAERPESSDLGDDGALWLATKVLPELAGRAAGDELADRLYRRLSSEEARPGPFASRLALALIERETALISTRSTRLSRARELAALLPSLASPGPVDARRRRVALRRLAILDGSTRARLREFSAQADRGEQLWCAELALRSGDRSAARALLRELRSSAIGLSAIGGQAGSDEREMLRRLEPLIAELEGESPDQRLQSALRAVPSSLSTRARRRQLIELRCALRAARNGPSRETLRTAMRRAERRIDELATGLGLRDRALIQAARNALGGERSGAKGELGPDASSSLLGRLVALEALRSRSRPAGESRVLSELESLRAAAPGLPWPELRGGELPAGAGDDLGRVIDLVLSLAIGPPGAP